MKDSLENKSSLWRVEMAASQDGIVLWAGLPGKLQFYTLRAEVSTGTSSTIMGR